MTCTLGDLIAALTVISNINPLRAELYWRNIKLYLQFSLFPGTIWHYFMLWTHKPNEHKHWSLISPLSPRTTVFSSTQWWCQINQRHWHCDIIFVDFSCMHKMVQSWYSDAFSWRQTFVYMFFKKSRYYLYRIWQYKVPNIKICINICELISFLTELSTLFQTILTAYI